MPEPDQTPEVLASDGDAVLEGVEPPTQEEWLAYSKENPRGDG